MNDCKKNNLRFNKENINLNINLIKDYLNIRLNPNLELVAMFIVNLENEMIISYFPNDELLYQPLQVFNIIIQFHDLNPFKPKNQSLENFIEQKFKAIKFRNIKIMRCNFYQCLKFVVIFRYNGFIDNKIINKMEICFNRIKEEVMEQFKDYDPRDCAPKEMDCKQIIKILNEIGVV
ncbi:MAG: hypothetical protein ACTSRZ_21500 [Promethearchaeota archaeon]